MYLKILIIFSVVILVFSCQEVVQVELEEGPKRLVVEGRIEKIKDHISGYQSINLSTTSDYFSNLETPRAIGAVVTVRDDQGNVFEFQESETTAGLYETFNLKAQIDRVYSMQIEYDGDIYTGSEKLNSVARIDSIYQEFKPENLFDEEGIRVKIDFTDPGAEENFYHWTQLQDGQKEYSEPSPGTKWTLVSSDEFYDGQKIIGREPNDEMIYSPGQVALVRQYAISKNEFEYMFLLYDQAAGNGPYDAPPATIRGNMQNITNPDHYPLGYFGASEVAEAELIIK